MRILFLRFVILTLCTVFENANTENPNVKLSHGELEGLMGISRSGRQFHKYLGIPYGKVVQRFGISEPADPWSGVKKVVDSGGGCISFPMLGGGVTGVEDCLTLDIYTPIMTNSTDVQLPVMVWIFGGGFISGSTSAYDGNFFMDEDVVLVMMNYRLGAIGFLNAGIPSARGNQGLKDQVLALHWVQENINHFGGDKNSVTIFGESAGSVSVSFMLTSPMTRDAGLFHRAIMQSGVSLMPAVNNAADGPALAMKLGEAVDCPTSNLQYLVECLQRVDPKILMGFGKFIDEFGYDENGLIVGPSYETYSDGEVDAGVFMKEDPYNSIKEGKVAKVPTIIGLMHTESGWTPALKNSTTLERLNAQWTRRLPSMLFMGKTAEDPGQICDLIKQHFFSGNMISNESQSVNELEHLLDERHWIQPFRFLAPYLFKHNRGAVYLYNFTKPMPSFPPPFGSGLPRKANHADDIRFFFGIRGILANFIPSLVTGHPDYELSKSLVKMWASFAKDGKPRPLWGSGQEETYWPPAFKNDTDSNRLPTFLFIDDVPKVERVGQWYENNGRFWDGLNLKEYGKLWPSEN